MLARAGLAQASTVIVGQPSAIRAIGARLAYDPVDLWKDYLTFHFISGMAAYLPPEFDEAHFAFYGRTLSGIPTQKARWKRGVSLLNHQLGEEVGQIYLKAHWSPAAQQQMDEMIGDLRAAYADKIDHAAWMDAPTRKAALAKLAAFEARVAGPRTFIDYTDFHPVADDPLANAMESQRFEWALRVKRFPAGRSRAVGHDAPDGECLLRPDHQSGDVPRC
jgi:endothelin-converting enzyme/putative endopeptidase